MLTLAASPAALGYSPALYGYDVVAYRSLNASANGTMGSAEFAFNLTTTDESGAKGQRMPPTNYTFHFASAANLARFAADPWKYTPAWGGF
tara:strand:+ start:746 stop:1018 length:273 start_codon:yes stop_codon:yes gene_type:complete